MFVAAKSGVESAVVESSVVAYVAAVGFAVAAEGQQQNWVAVRCPYWAFLVSLG